MLRKIALAAALLLAACSSAADAPDQWRAVPVEIEPVELGVETLGRLAFRGGIAISSEDSVFGGLSGIEVLDDGRFVAVSDNGDWFEARLVLDDQGRLVGISGVRTAFMRDENGQGFANKAAGDSEDVAQLPDGRFAVSFEQSQTIRIYDLNRDGPFGAATAGPRLDGVARLPGNAGLEALTATANGALLAGAEGGERATTPLWLANLDARGRVPARINYPLEVGFSLTSLDRLPNGDFVALERFYAPIVGARARLTTFAANALNARAETLPDVEELALLAPPMPVDNFEGVSAVLLPNGGTRIYIVSDDNFSDRQRTLLYAFDLVSQGPP